MPIDFPANPTNGQVYSNWIYDSSISAWRNVNTDTGVAALNTMGLRNVVPTSVVVGSGSATTNANGLVTFSAASSISLNGVFNSTYNHYKIIAKFHGSTTTGVSFRWRSAGTDRTVAAYYSSGWFARANNAANGYWSANATSLYDIGRVETTTDQRSFVMMDCFDPFDSTKSTSHTYQWQGQDASGLLGGFSNGGYLQQIQFDGFSIFPGAGNLTGTIEVFGYTN
jgi:hypothetical protein